MTERKIRTPGALWLLFLFLSCISCFAQDEIHTDRTGQPITVTPPTSLPQQPWLTGPLLAPVGTVVPYGHFSVESYVYGYVSRGNYNGDWDFVQIPHNFATYSSLFQCFFGLTPWCDLVAIPQLTYNVCSNQHSLHFADLPVGLDFQLLNPGATSFPGIKLTIQETFPTGNYERLHSEKLQTDLTGAGAFGTTFFVVLYDVYHLYNLHWISMTLSGSYTINTSAKVHGFNAYGGGFGTHGKVEVGNSWQFSASFEFTLNQNWVLAFDNVYTHTDASPFLGTVGTAASGLPADVGYPSAELISFAPAIEYNFSSQFGIEAGCWLTAWGRNSNQFQSGVINFYYYY